MKKSNGSPNRLETPRLVIPPEVDISDYPWRRRITPWAQSTEELLRPEVDVDVERADDTASISNGETKSLRRTSGPAVELPLRLTDRKEVGIRISQFSLDPARPVSRAVSPVSSRLSLSENDIELHQMHFALPSAGMQSTDTLVPHNHSRKSKVHDHGGQEDRTLMERPTPDYKPIPLRWPFQALVFVLIFGVFTFFEYQVRKLPPVRYQALEFGNTYAAMSAGSPAATPALSTQASEIATASVPPVAKGNPFSVPTTTFSPIGAVPTDQIDRPIVTAAPRILVASPRPPESAYPSPPARVTAYCGWKPPIWVFFNRPGYETLIGGQPTKIALPALLEEIPMFTTSDPSWCPCTVLGNLGGIWGSQWRMGYDGVESWWETNDDGCRSAMNLISSFNSIKTVAFKTDIPALRTKNMYFSTAPSDLPVSPFWGLPTTYPNGDIVYPLEVRKAISGERHDVFGNKIAESGAIATFLGERCCSSGNPLPAKTPKACAADVPMLYPLVCADLATLTTPLTAEVCTEYVPYTPPCAAGATAVETIWWTLPFGKPMSTTASSTGTVSSTSRIPSTETASPPVSSASLTSQTLPITTTSTESAWSTSSTHLQGHPSESTESTAAGTLTEASSATQVPSPSSPSGIIGLPVSIDTTSTEFQSDSNSRTQATTASNSSGIIGPPIIVGTTTAHTQSFTPTTTFGTGTGGGTVVKSTQGHQTELPTPASLITTANPALQSTPSMTVQEPTQLGSGGSTTNSSEVYRTVSDVILIYYHKDTPFRTTTVTRYLSMYASLRPGTYTIDLDSNEHNTVFTLETSAPSPTRPAPLPGPISPDSYGAFFNLRSEADFLMASLVPVLLATLLKIPIQILTGCVNIALPFRALAKYKGGAPAKDSLFLSQRAISGPLVAFRFLSGARDPLALLNVILSTLSTLLVPLSTETIRLEFTTMYCSSGGEMCAYGLRNAGAPLRVAEAFLVTMAVLITIIGFMLARSSTGFATEPWSIASMTSLLASSESELRTLVRSIPSSGKYIPDSKILEVLEGKRFRLTHYTSPVSTYKRSEKSAPRYGIQVLPIVPADNSPIRPTTRDPPEHPSTSETKFWHISPAARDLSIRVTALIVHVGLLILILYYENTTTDTAFEAFMNSESFGVRLLFTTFGTAVSVFWDYYFFQISDTHIHTLLATRPRYAKDSILLEPPSNPFIGLYRFLRSKDTFAFSIALTAILAKFTPILFANIPFRNTVTWKNHEACTWLSVAFLSWMVIVLVWSLLMEWDLRYILAFIGAERTHWNGVGNRRRVVNMPVSTDTMIGCMYYLAWSDKMHRDFEGLETLNHRERDRLVSEMGRLYTMREFSREGTRRDSNGRSDKASRVGVDYWVPEVPKSTRSSTSTGDRSSSEGSVNSVTKGKR